MSHRYLNRRTLLRGSLAGLGTAAIGLPKLSAMLNTNGTAYAQGDPLGLRFGVWFHGLGNVPSRWNPAQQGQGTSWSLSEQLQPFASTKPYLTVVSGMDVYSGGFIHIEGSVGMLTGAPHTEDDSVELPSIDQAIASIIGGATPYRSLEVGVCRATANGGDGTAWQYVSHTGRNAPKPPEYDARALFSRLFGIAPQPAVGEDSVERERQARAHRSILDLVIQDAVALRAQLGQSDIQRVDAHLEGLRELERRVSTLSGAACGQLPENAYLEYPQVLPDLNNDVPPELNRAMAELVTFALACDLTRVFSFQWSRPAAHVYFRALGFDEDFHDDIQHVEGGDQPKVNQCVIYTMGHLDVLLQLMKDTPDGAGNLLDSSCILATSDNGFGREHSTEDFPILLFGHAGGALRGDQHIRLRGDNTTKVLLSLANIYGANVTSYGAKEGTASSGIPGLGPA